MTHLVLCASPAKGPRGELIAYIQMTADGVGRFVHLKCHLLCAFCDAQRTVHAWAYLFCLAHLSCRRAQAGQWPALTIRQGCLGLGRQGLWAWVTRAWTQVCVWVYVACPCSLSLSHLAQQQQLVALGVSVHSLSWATDASCSASRARAWGLLLCSLVMC